MPTFFTVYFAFDKVLLKNSTTTTATTTFHLYGCDCSALFVTPIRPILQHSGFQTLRTLTFSYPDVSYPKHL